MMICNTIPATKANRLFWLGRYAERGYLSLHLLRRYYDKMIDDPNGAFEEFYSKLDSCTTYNDVESFKLGCLYDVNNSCSIMSGLEAANDNAIVLREEISTETLSYIQLSLYNIKRNSDVGETNITQMQVVTDYLLAFWGSIYERVFDERIRNFLRIGRLIEYLDMHVRFDYKYFRIEEAFENLKSCALKEPSIFDATILSQLEEMITEPLYNNQTMDYKNKILTYLNNVVLI